MVFRSSFGFTLDSEATMRQNISEELPFNLAADVALLAAKDGALLARPVVSLPDLRGLVLHYFDQPRKAGTLSWQTHALSSEEIWVKIGGDHGAGTSR